MARKNNKVSPPSNNSRVDLTKIKDTCGTIDSTIPLKGKNQAVNQEYVKVEPPFKSETAKSNIDWGKISTFITIGIFVLTCLASAIWYISHLDSDVDKLKSDIKEVKEKTDDLVKTTIQHNEKLYALDKSITTFMEKKTIIKSESMCVFLSFIFSLRLRN